MPCAPSIEERFVHTWVTLYLNIVLTFVCVKMCSKLLKWSKGPFNALKSSFETIYSQVCCRGLLPDQMTNVRTRKVRVRARMRVGMKTQYYKQIGRVSHPISDYYGTLSYHVNLYTTHSKIGCQYFSSSCTRSSREPQWLKNADKAQLQLSPCTVCLKYPGHGHCDQETLLLSWINFDPKMDKWSHAQ